jgi:hypothetical protein
MVGWRLTQMIQVSFKESIVAKLIVVPYQGTLHSTTGVPGVSAVNQKKVNIFFSR